MQQGNFIDVFLARHVSGAYAYHQEHQTLSCSIWFCAPSFWMGGGVESCCVGRVCSADVAVQHWHFKLCKKHKHSHDHTITERASMSLMKVTQEVKLLGYSRKQAALNNHCIFHTRRHKQTTSAQAPS